MINVYMIQTYSFCPLKVFLEASMGLKSKPTEHSILGRLAHEIYQDFSLSLGNGVEIYTIFDEVVHEKSTKYGLGIKQVEKLAKSIAEFRSSTPLAGVPVYTEYEVESEILGVKGRIDIVEGFILVEVKYKSKLSMADIEQLTVYGMLLEEKFSRRIKYGFVDVLKEKKRIRVDFVNVLREHCRRLLKHVLEAALAPKTPAKLRCKNCDLKLECKMLYNLKQ